MRLANISSGCNLFLKNNNYNKNKQTQINAINISANSLSFKAKIPAEIFSCQKYESLFNDYERIYRLGLSQPDMIKLLQYLKDDNEISDKFKSEMLLSNNNSAFISRVESAKNNKAIYNTDFDFGVVNAMLMASPDKDTTKKLLLTPLSKNGKTCGIPLHYANAKIANLLLCSSPDEDTLKKQLFFSDENGNIPFATANDETKLIMLESCDDDTKIKLLSDPSVVFHDNSFNISIIMAIKSILDNSTYRKAKLAILQAINPKTGDNILHNLTNNFEYTIRLCKQNPEIYKNLIFQENNNGNIPAETQFDCCPKNAYILLEAALDDETLSKQLFHKNNSGLFIDKIKDQIYRIIIAFPSDIDSTIQKTMFYKTKSNLPVIESMTSTQIIDILNKTKSFDIKREILLADWSKDVDKNKPYYRSSTADIIQHTLHSDKYKEYIAKNVLETIQDDSTTYKEALDLIHQYYSCVGEFSKETFRNIEKYITSNYSFEE